jgi:hypothetical protein
MRFFEFIFLKRKIEDDKDTIINNLKKSKELNRPMWLVLFPEGTGKYIFPSPFFLASVLLFILFYPLSIIMSDNANEIQ